MNVNEITPKLLNEHKDKMSLQLTRLNLTLSTIILEQLIRFDIFIWNE